MGYESKKVTGTGVGSSSSSWGQVGSKPGASGKAHRPVSPVGVNSGSGASRTLPSGTYKNT